MIRSPETILLWAALGVATSIPAGAAPEVDAGAAGRLVLRLDWWETEHGSARMTLIDEFEEL